MVELKHQQQPTQIILRPNRSLSWQEAKWVMSIMIFFVMVIALAWSFVGAWLVLPFAGLEVGLFTYLLYRITHWTYLTQVITFHDEEILVETGINKRISRESISKQGLEVHIEKSELNWRTPIFTLQNKGLEIKLGEFLNIDDMKVLKESFETLGFIVCNNHWWKD